MLEHSVHGTRATATGELLYRYAKTILRQFEDIRSAIRRESESPSGRVAIGFPTSTSRVLVAPLLARLQKRYPLIELELVEVSRGDLTGQVAADRRGLATTMDAVRFALAYRADPGGRTVRGGGLITDGTACLRHRDLCQASAAAISDAQ